MVNIDDLYVDKCLMTFRYHDGSEVQCIVTLNQQILQRLSLDSVDGFVDLLSYKIIPMELFTETETVYIELGEEPKLSFLDEFFQEAIKRRWEDI